MLKRKTPLKAKTGFKKPTKPINKIGRRGKMNARATKEGDKEINRLGIRCCELRIEDICLGSYALTRAHRKKRRFCDEKELTIYAIACVACHNFAESKSHKEMFEIINEAILKR